MRTKYSYSAARATFSICNAGVAWATLRGPVTPMVLECAKRDAMSSAGGPVAVWGADMRGAAVVLTGGALDAVLCSERVGALVVSPEAAELFHAHAWRMAQRGIVRRVFVCVTQAKAWAAQQARTVAQQAAWERERMASAHCLTM